MNLVEVPLGRKLLLPVIGELDEGGALRRPNRLEVVHAAAEHLALEDVARQALLLPLGNEHAACEMAARRSAAKIELIGVATEGSRVPVHPGDGAAALIDHREQVAVGLSEQSNTQTCKFQHKNADYLKTASVSRQINRS